MAKKTARSLADAMAAEIEKKTSSDVPVTGLGETIDQIEAKVAAALKALAPFFRKDAILKDATEAAYQYGLVEKRARKLRKRVGR